MSEFTTGSAIYQKQTLRLMAYLSKTIPSAAQNYFIAELELCGLAINLSHFSHFLKRVDFNALVDHFDLTHAMKRKTEPARYRHNLYCKQNLRTQLHLKYFQSFNLQVHHKV